MNGINTSDYTYRKTEYGTFLDASKDIQKVSKDSVDVDSFVRVKPSYTDNIDPTICKYLDGAASSEHSSRIEECINQFFDGTMSESELQAEYGEMLKKELFGSMENPPSPLTESQKETAMDFYNAFRQKILSVAVERNNAEGEQYITGDMNVQRSWSYYNSDYYYTSESAISAITNATQTISQEYDTTFEVPDYLKQGKTNLYNFNTALEGDPFIVSDYHYIVDPDVAPPKNFKWFYQTGGDPYNCIRMTSFGTIDENGNEVIEKDFTTDEFDPTDPSKAQTWVSYTDEDGVEHRLSTDIVFDDSKDDLRNMLNLLSFSDKDADKANLLNKFLPNLQIYPKGYFDRFPVSARSMDFKI